MTKSVTATLPDSFAGFRDLHKGETIIVCGCGESLNELTDPGRFITIGVNDVGRLFDPTYLLVLNPKNQFKGDRFSYVECSRAQAVFSQLKLSINHPKLVHFKLGQRGGTAITTQDVLPYAKNSPYVALSLAMYMGARRIALIGVDFTDHHFYGRTGSHPLSRQLGQINSEYQTLKTAANARGIEIVNLSSASRITAFTKASIEEFCAEKTLPPKPDTVSEDQPVKIFGVNYKFLACGDVFTDGLQHAADELGVEYTAAYWNDPTLPQKIKQFSPNLVVVVHGRKFVQKWRHRIQHDNMAIWLLDEPYEVDDTQKISRYFKHVFVNDPSTLKRHRNSHYLPVAYDPLLHTQGDEERIYDVGFIGGYNKTRENYLLQLLEAGHLSYVVGGPWKDRRLKAVCRANNISPQETAALYRKTRIVVNVFRDIHHFNRAGVTATSLNPRVYEALACGASVVSEYRPELEQAFPEILTFNNGSELLAVIKTLLEAPDRINDMVRACQEKLPEHSYASRLQQILHCCLPGAITEQLFSARETRQESTNIVEDKQLEYAILMVVHNACDMVKMSVLRTLQHSAGKNAHLYVVDNASKDGVEQWLSMLAKRDDITLIRSDSNIGHGPGLELARSKSQSNYIVSLDSDAFPLADDWLEKLHARLTGEHKITGICHHRNYIHPSCLMIERQCMDELGLTFLEEKNRPSQFDVAERMTHEVMRRGFSISGLQRSGSQRRGSISEPIYLGSSYADLVYHQWYTTRSVLQDDDCVDDVPAGAITNSLQELFRDYQNQPREVTVIIGVRAGKQDRERIRNIIAVVNAINLQDIPRWRYRVILVEQDSEPRLQQSLSSLVDHYQFIYNPGAYNRGWAFNVGAGLASKTSGYLCLLDADLLVPADYLSQGLDALAAGCRALRPFSRVTYLDDSSSERAINKRLHQAQELLVADDYDGRIYTNSEGGCIWVAAKLYHEIGGHDERFRGWGGEDREFSRRLSKNTKIHRLKAGLLHLYHPEPANNTRCVSDNMKLLKRNRAAKIVLSRQPIGDPHRYVDEQIDAPGTKKLTAVPGMRDWEHWQQWTESRIEDIVINQRRNRVAVGSLRKQLVDHVVVMGSHILDVGCGAGALWPYLQDYQQNVSCVGVDVTDKMLQVAHRLFPSIPVVRTDAGCLPFADQSFDVVVLRHVIEHLPSWLMQKCLREALRVARNAVVIGFYIAPSNKGKTKSRRVGEGFLETSWSASELNSCIELAEGRVFQQKLIRENRNQAEMMWFVEPATVLRHQTRVATSHEEYKISIIMPTFRRQHTIYRTIESIRKQSYSNWELIVVDNEGHGDYCFDDPRILLYRHSEVTGASYARNQGLQYATGDLLCFFDDDDDMYPEYLEQFVTVFQSRPAVKMVRCGMVVSDGSINYSYATPECCLRRGFATPSWLSDGPCQDQNYFRRIIKLRGWSESRGNIVSVRQALCQANTDMQGGLRAGQY